MSGWKKLASAAAASGAGLNVEDVFSTYLYDGNGSTQTITNGIDLAGEGGMVWTKNRTLGVNHNLTYTDDASDRLFPNLSNAADTGGSSWSYASDGYSVTGNNTQYNYSGSSFASWTFRKAPKFFDVVTYTGNSTAGRTVSHNLGSVPGMIIVKRLDLTTHWAVYHRGMHPTSPEDYYMRLNDTLARQDSASWWNDTAPTSTEFTLGSSSTTNGTGSPFVAYLFAHNDGDGEFGPNGDQDIIKCGSYTGNGSTAIDVDLGFEPQWVLVKNASRTNDPHTSWFIVDNMRGATNGSGGDARLSANKTDSETVETFLFPYATGFQVKDGGYDLNFNGDTYIYVAIRRGPMAVPESATDVFAMDTQISGPPSFISDFPVDMSLTRYSDGGHTYVGTRLTGQRHFLGTASPNSEQSSTQWVWDHMDGWYYDGSAASTNRSWMWRRAPNYFDVVCYAGTGSNQTIDHNLGIAPEMMWVKARDRTGQWVLYHTGIGNTGAMWINDIGDGVITDSSYWNNTSPSDTNFSLGNNFRVNQSGYSYIAYLFGSVDGVSKVGSYTGDGTDGRTIDCGFSSGARFVFIKELTANQDFIVFDTMRGIVSGNDPFFSANNTNADNSGFDMLDPDNSGFQVNSTIGYVNENNKTYVFYAIA